MVRSTKYIRYMPGLVAILLGCVGLLSEARAQTYDAYATADSVTIGERFEIAVVVEHDGSRTPLFPHQFLPDSLAERPAFEIGGFTFLGNSTPARRQISPNWVVDSLRYEVATFEIDSAYVPMLPIGLASESDTLIAGTSGVLVWIASLVPDDADAIRDITGLADFPGIPWFWYAIPILVLLLAFWLWRRNRQPVELEADDYRPEPEEPAWDEAQRRLRALETTDLANPDNIKPYYVELSELLRTYISRRAHVPALETTTRELILRLRQAISDGVVREDIIRELEAVLSNADLVKFADMHPSSETGKEALTRTRNAIVGTEEEIEARDRARRQAEAESARQDMDEEVSEQEEELIGHD